MTTVSQDGIQIVIGSMHIGFGIILGLLSYSTTQYWGFGSFTFISGYPFWGGICFIISGSLSITTFKEFSPCLIKSSLGMNIVSSIFSLIGAILLLLDLCINGLVSQAYWAVISGKGISAMLMIFSLLEFCITCATAHFAKQMVTNTSGSVLVIPAVYANNLTQESSSAPPRNDGWTDHVAPGPSGSAHAYSLRPARTQVFAQAHEDSASAVGYPSHQRSLRTGSGLDSGLPLDGHAAASGDLALRPPSAGICLFSGPGRWSEAPDQGDGPGGGNLILGLDRRGGNSIFGTLNK
ncbi:LOW QUALITY PROTEIN: membrane-spanning 4-domains subfamily A member 12 [Urocitellus parryii]